MHPCQALFLDRPVGLLALLDEESHFPNASDETLAAKLAMHFKDHPSFSPPQVCASIAAVAALCHAPVQGTDCSFSIRHYAAEVEYQVYGFLLKNRDSMSPDVVAILRESELSVVAESFLASVSSTGQVVWCWEGLLLWLTDCGDRSYRSEHDGAATLVDGNNGTHRVKRRLGLWFSRVLAL